MTSIFDGSAIVRLSAGLGGVLPNDESLQVVLSPDGSKAAFTSRASNLVAGDTNGSIDVFVENLSTGAIERVSVDSTGIQANNSSFNPTFSPDGTKLAFVGSATNWPGDNHAWVDLYVKDLSTGTLRRIAMDVEVQGDEWFGHVRFSADGSTLMFLSRSADLVPGDTNGTTDIFVADLASGAITRVEGSAGARSAVLSPDGTKIAFTNWVAAPGIGGPPGIVGIIVKDLMTGETRVIADDKPYYPSASLGPVFSPDGALLAYFRSGGVYVQDVATGEDRLVSVDPAGSWPLVRPHAPVFSPDGSKVAFWAELNGGYKGSFGEQILIKDLVSGTLMVATTGATGAPAWHDPGLGYDLSWVGDKLAFSSEVSDGFAPGDGPDHAVPFVRLMSFVSVAPLDAAKQEGDSGTTPFTFTVTRQGDTSLEQSVHWTASDLYAAPWWRTDATASGTIDFAPGEASRTIVVEKNADARMDLDREFTVKLSDPTGGLLVDGATANGMVVNDDVRPHDDAFLVAAGEALHVPATAPTSWLQTKGVFIGGPGLPDLGVSMSTHGQGGVLANDDTTVPLTASLVHGPAHGILVFAADGSFDYTPDAGFTGIDRFTYSIDGTAVPAERQALIYVIPQVEGETTTLDLVALTAEEQVAATYLSFFGRAADAAGFEFWVDQFHAGQATQTPAILLANIASSFAISDEARGFYAFLANPSGATDERIGSFLAGVYVNLFGRRPDEAGRAYWTDQVKHTLANGEFVGSVLVDIMSGALNTGAHQDISTLMGKVAVSLAYAHEQELFGVQWSEQHMIEARTILQEVTADPGTVLLGVAFAQNVISVTYGGN